jgi:hypothetical protein
MIYEYPNGHQLRKLSNPAVVIRVEMADEQVVDLRNARVARGSNDPVRVPRLMRITGANAGTITSVPRINQQRAMVRCDEQGRLSSLYVDEVDLKALRFRSPHTSD